MELRDKKIGLVGLGKTGYTTARVAIGFRYAGLCTDFQVTPPVAAGNQENGLRPTVQRM